jgi:hypothetical protein
MKDQLILENLYLEMAYGLSGTGESITKKELIEHIIALDGMGRGAMNVSFTSIVTPKFRKTGFPHKNLFKLKQVQGIIGDDYEAGVNRQREKEGVEGEFKALPSTTVKEYISSSIGITFRDNYVILYKPKLLSNPSYFFIQTNIGKIQEVPKEQIQQYLQEYKPSGRQEVDKAVHRLTYGIDSLVGIKIEGKDHIIEDADPIKKHIFELAQDRLKI